tara:strand:+ start:139 stop:609 length:471 start_codon:yes stop_codon:yes gene_type:complete
LKICIIAVGRLKADYARLGCTRFLDRLSRAFTVKHVEVKDVRRTRGTHAQWKAEEAKLIKAQIPKGAVVVALDERGREWSSPELAGWIDNQRNRSVSQVAFILGGPDGLDPELRSSAHRVWSLGKMTLPHELARLVVLEQLYRAGSLLNGHPYHRD